MQLKEEGQEVICVWTNVWSKILINNKAYRGKQANKIQFVD